MTLKKPGTSTAKSGPKSTDTAKAEEALKDAGLVDPTTATDEDWVEVDPFAEAIEPKEGEPVIGIFQGTRTVEVKDDKEESGIREQTIHEFADPATGELFSVWGSGLLDKKLSNFSPGAHLKIVWEGMRDLSDGRRAHAYRVWENKSAPF